MNKNISLLVNSCDDYEEIWEPFFCALKKYWKEFNYPVVLNTESKKYTYDGIDIKCYGSSSSIWGKRFLEHLIRIETKYVLNFFDDYLINKELNSTIIEKCINLLDENSDIAVIYLVDITEHELENKISEKNKTIYKLDNRTSFQLMPNRLNYRLNSAPGIWRVRDLMNFTSPNDTPWVWEFFGSARTYNSNKKFYCVASGQCNIVNYVNDRGMGGAIHRGKWLLSAVQFIEENLELEIKNKTCRCIKKSAENLPHSFFWKVKFMISGFRAVGFSAFIFLYRAFKKRYMKLFLGEKI